MNQEAYHSVNQHTNHGSVLAKLTYLSWVSLSRTNILIMGQS